MMLAKSISGILYNYLTEAADTLGLTDLPTLSAIAERILATKQTGATIFTAGNGGSASTASHICNDLVKGCRVLGRTGFRAVCLNDANAVLTCLANDFCYEDVYSIMLQTYARKGDLLIVYSGSGNSENILRAVETAKAMGVYTIAFTGRTGGKLGKAADLTLFAPTDCMELLEDYHLMYEHALVTAIRQQLPDRFDVEIVRRHHPDAAPKAALFDFDGTVSLIRAGWQDVMIPYFTEVLSAAPKAEDAATCKQIVTDFVDTLTGKQTIFQCIALDEAVVARGGEKVDPLVYKHEYLRRLRMHIAERIAALEAGENPEQYLVPGAVTLIRALRNAGISCYLASGTDETDVLHEAKLLGVQDLFDGGIYGARDEILDCSKELVIQNLLAESCISGENLVSFGDGYVEVELVHNIGGYTFGVATDEERRCGINAWKRNRLTAAGADAIIPDFSNPARILDMIL